MLLLGVCAFNSLCFVLHAFGAFFWVASIVASFAFSMCRVVLVVRCSVSVSCLRACLFVRLFVGSFVCLRLFVCVSLIWGAFYVPFVLL